METQGILCSCNDFVGQPCMEHSIRIENWKLVWASKGLEHKKDKGYSLLYRLNGIVNGKELLSEPIIQSSGIFALTSGDIWYVLGIPNESWIRWMAKTLKYAYNPANPLNIKGLQ